jgi:hypothetical protein
MEPFLSAIVLLSDDQLLSSASGPLTFFDIQPTICRTSRTAMDFLSTRKFDLLLADFDIEGVSELVEMNVTNARGYRSTVIALTSNLERVSELLTKRIHFAVLKPFTKDRIVEVLTSACNLMLIEKRTSFRHAVMINAICSVLENGAKTPLASPMLLDISRTGVCLKTKPVLTEGASVLVDFRLPGTQDDIHTIGKVMWSDRHGRAGINFVYVPPQEFRKLRDYLNARCPWSELMAKIPEFLKANATQSRFEIGENPREFG